MVYPIHVKGILVKRAFSALVTAVAIVLATLALTPAASAAPNYTGLDPTGRCSDAQTLKSVDVEGDGTLQVRWSKKCNTLWARFNVYGGLSGAGAPITHVKVMIVRAPEKAQMTVGKAFEAFGGASYWSGMISATNSGRACVSVERTFGDTNATESSTKSTLGRRSLGWYDGPCV